MTDTTGYLLLSVILIGSAAAAEFNYIETDQRGRALNPDQNDCATVRTLGIFDLLDVPMDCKQMLAIFRLMFCFYNYNADQRQQFNVCLRVGVS